jgi:Flp pilus assembly protein TadD/serine/threonine protein kinase
MNDRTTPPAVNCELEALLGQVADEFTERLKQGEQPDIEEYVERHPQIGDLLRQVLGALQVMGPGELELGPATDGAEAAAFPTGCLGDFRIAREIGRGGMGIVYEAEQISLARPVALKVLPFAATLDGKQLQRFKNEAQAAAQLHHTNIVPIYGVGCERGVHYYAMQYIAGQNLAEIIADLRLQISALTIDKPARSPAAAAEAKGSPDEQTQATAHVVLGDPPIENRKSKIANTTLAALSTERSHKSSAFFRTVAGLGVQAAEALEHAHLLGVIHRDIKPANLLIDHSPLTTHHSPRLWITDFGLAYCRNQAGLTLSGDLIGTLRYMSPEQAWAKRVMFDHRTDIYSLGVTLYELLTLEPAFAGTDREELLRQIAFEEPRPPRRINKSIPAELEIIVLKAMEKNPADRYATAQEMADDLRRHLDDKPIQAKRPGLGVRLAKWSRRHRPLVASLASAAAVLLVASAIGALVYASRARELAKERVRTNLAINDTLAEALRFASQARNARRDDPVEWARAREMARRAETLAENGLADPALVTRVRELRIKLDEEEQDRRMLARLQAASMQTLQTNVAENRFSDELAIGDYEAAFKEYGIDRASVSAEQAGARIRERPPEVKLAMIVALDHWIEVESQLPKKSAAGRQKQRWLEAVVRAADNDPWRKLIREAAGASQSQPLAHMAASPEMNKQPPYTLEYFGRMLCRTAQTRNLGLRVLRRAQRSYPGDFRLNQILGKALSMVSPVQPEEVVRLCWIGVALQPENAVARVNLGAALSSHGKLEEAIAEYRRAIALKPDLAAAHSNLGVALERQGNLDEAIAEHRKAIALKPDDGLALYNLGGALDKQGKLDEAIVEFRRFATLKPDGFWTHFGLAVFLERQGKHDEAIAEFRKTIALYPDSAAAHDNLGLALEKRGKLDEAIAEYRKVVALNPTSASAHNNLSVCLDRQGKLDEAIAEFRKAIALNPDSALYHTNLGAILERQGKVDGAIAEYRKAIALNPDSTVALKNLGLALGKLGELNEAITRLRRAIVLKPDDADAHCNLGTALERQGKVDEAIAAYRKAIALNAEQPNAHNNLGAVLARQGRLDEAIAMFQKAVALKTDDADAFRNLGLALQMKGKVDEAVAAYRKAIALKPRNPVAHNNLGLLLEKQGKPGEAITAFRKAIALQPENAQAHDNLAWILATSPDPKLRDPRRALEHAKRTVHLAPAASMITLGVAHYRAGDWTAAIAALEKSIKLGGAASSFNTFFLAMAHWKIGNKKEARTRYEQGVQWMRKNAPEDKELIRFRAEAEALLAIRASNPKDGKPNSSRSKP